jgi:ATP-binding cassette subfamily B protein
MAVRDDRSDVKQTTTGFRDPRHHICQKQIPIRHHICQKQIPIPLLLPLTLVFVVAAITSGALRIILLWAQTRLGHAIGADLSFEIYRSTLYQPYATHVSRNSSEIIAGITDKANGVASGFIIPLMLLISSALLLISVMATLLSINSSVALAAFISFGAVYAVIIFSTKKRLLLNSKRINRLVTRRIKSLQEGLGGIRDVLLDSTQSTYTAIYREADLPLRHATASNQVIAGSPRFGIEALGMVLIAVLAYTLILSGDEIIGAIPVLGALAIGAQRMLPTLQQGYSSWSSIKGADAVLNDVLKLLEQPLPSYLNQKQPAPMQFDTEIILRDLSFRYSPNAPWVLRHLDLKINKGARVGFIGTTGSGKSTLLDILMGLLEPSDGQLIIDNTIVDADNHRPWRANVAHVPQTIFLADSTIAENIAFGIPLDKVDQDRVRKAAHMAQIGETIEGWNGQ